MEQWRDIKGYEGLYKVSNNGKIYSYYRGGKMMKDAYTVDGYKHINLRKEGKQKCFLIHRIVALAFIPNPQNLPFVNHKDECKTNNFVCIEKDGSVNLDNSNLEWCTKKYNNNYGTVKQRSRTSHLNHKALSKPVLCFMEDVFVKEYPSMQEAERQTGIHQANISKCCNGIRKFAGGYIWKYKSLITNN